MDFRDRRPRVPNRDIVAAALRSEGLRSRVPRLAGVSPNELSTRLRDSARFHDDFEAAIDAAWAAAHGGKMADGTDAHALVEQLRDQLDRQRSTDYRDARERQEKEAAKRQAARIQAAEQEAARQKAAKAAEQEAAGQKAAKAAAREAARGPRRCLT